MPRLTEHLVNLPTVPTYAEATNHLFLVAAGTGTLSADRLALYLSQDRIFVSHAYPAFIGSIIASIPRDISHGIFSLQEQYNQHILSVMVCCLQNVIREVNFFQEVCERWGLPLDGWRERKGTRDYTAEMGRISKNGRIEDALIFLWAIERVYLDAWSFVANRLKSSGIKQATAVSSLARHWSSREFVTFVGKLATLVDDLEIQPGTDEWNRAEAIWSRVIELEVGFWPAEGEEFSPPVCKQVRIGALTQMPFESE